MLHGWQPQTQRIEHTTPRKIYKQKFIRPNFVHMALRPAKQLPSHLVYAGADAAPFCRAASAACTYIRSALASLLLPAEYVSGKLYVR